MKISVIIPIYNAEATIEKCVNSILANEDENIEVILIDDCSRDSSWKICQRFEKTYSCIKCVRNEENRGVSYTRNHGLKVASGDYLMFVDSDDWVDNNYFKEFRQVLDEFSPQLVVCGYVNHDEKVNGAEDIFVWDDFTGIARRKVKTSVKELYDKTLLQQLWNKAFVTKLVKEKDIWFDENISIGEDSRFILDYIQVNQIEEVFLINKPLYHYIRGIAGSLMYRVGYESVEEPLKNLRKLYGIMGLSVNEIDDLIAIEREKQIGLYAYLIYHNAGMPNREKRKLILALDEKQGKELYKKNRVLFWKERVAIVLKRLTKHGK